jgi:glycerol-3-phosphate acyltransferase PlsX
VTQSAGFRPATTGSAARDPGAASGRSVRVAVDAMGGDHGPVEVVNGVLRHAREHEADQFILVGDEATILGIARELPPNVSIVHATQIIGMDE